VSYRGKKILVTGADGFIGSHLAEALARDGAKVSALALYTGLDKHGWLDEIDTAVRGEMKVIRGDVRDGAFVSRLAAGQDIIFHLAALIAVPYSYDAVASYIDVNVTGTMNVLEAARAHGVARVVHTSTSEVYGTAQTVPIGETHPLVAQSPYAASKIAADKLAESYAHSFGIPVAILRPFNTYGPRQSERAVIASTIRQALDPHCDKIQVGDLEPIRDFNYVADTVSAFMTIGTSNAIELGRAYNAGTGDGATIAHVVDLIRGATGSNKPVATEQARNRPAKSEVRELIADAGKFRAATGWQPKVDLKSGIQTTVAWWRKRIDAGLVRPGADYLL